MQKLFRNTDTKKVIRGVRNEKKIKVMPPFPKRNCHELNKNIVIVGKTVKSAKRKKRNGTHVDLYVDALVVPVLDVQIGGHSLKRKILFIKTYHFPRVKLYF